MCLRLVKAGDRVLLAGWRGGALVFLLTSIFVVDFVGIHIFQGIGDFVVFGRACVSESSEQAGAPPGSACVRRNHRKSCRIQHFSSSPALLVLPSFIFSFVVVS